MESTTQYYDRLASYYKYIYADWEGSLQRQAEALDGVIRELVGPGAHRILDAACGIGTQSIGLAQLGYQVTASDISLGGLEQARAQATQRGLTIEFRIADMRELWETYRQQFDVVIACDNAVPHLLSDDDILDAFRQFYACTRPGGSCLISVRDYADIERSGQQLHPRQVHTTPTGRVVLFDVWDFEGDYYQMTTYIVEDNGTAMARTHVMRGRYYCVQLATLEALMTQAGFTQVRTLRDRFFQPLVVGKRE